MVDTRKDKRQREKNQKKVLKLKELKTNQGYKAGPLVIGLFLFILLGSVIF